MIECFYEVFMSLVGAFFNGLKDLLKKPALKPVRWRIKNVTKNAKGYKDWKYFQKYSTRRWKKY
jgi:hypothetical protein